MYKIKTNELGEITVTRELVETIAGLAALDCYGLVGMVPQNIQSGISNILGMESIRKGVEVSTREDGLVIDVHVIVGYGIKISKLPQCYAKSDLCLGKECRTSCSQG